MRRFIEKQWWTFILAIGFAAASLALPAPSRAEDPIPNPEDQPIGGTESGDPDGPGPTGGRLSHRGVPARGALHAGRFAVGDGGLTDVRVSRLLVVWHGLRVTYFRF
jgi:hypothetical protein